MPEQRVRLECRACGAHTLVRSLEQRFTRCTVCGSTDLRPIEEVPPQPGERVRPES